MKNKPYHRHRVLKTNSFLFGHTILNYFKDYAFNLLGKFICYIYLCLCLCFMQLFKVKSKIDFAMKIQSCFSSPFCKLLQIWGGGGKLSQRTPEMAGKAMDVKLRRSQNKSWAQSHFILYAKLLRSFFRYKSMAQDVRAWHRALLGLWNPAQIDLVMLHRGNI